MADQDQVSGRDEAVTQGEEDDFELHKKVKATDDAPAEGESDDFELHKKIK